MSYAGAHFRKSDFQIHSPRDHGWDGARPDGLIAQRGTPLPAEVRKVREEWARNFLSACKDRKLQAVAITDHHEGVYIWDIIRVKDDLVGSGEDLDLWIFPGMELTTKDSAQAIVLFDADLPQTLFEKARSLLRLPSDCKAFEPRGIEVQPLGFHIEDLQDAFGSDDELRDRFIILPNVTPQGHKTVLRKGFHKRFKEMPYVGGYLDGQGPDDLKEQDRKKLDGAIPAWGSTRRGVIATSDAREADFRNLGANPTWIKLASPTAESLRQAMLAADSRIRYTEPHPTSIFIQEVAIAGATFLQVSGLAFSPQYNALIGGRGAGKSTLLEFIRFALGQSALDSAASDWDPTHSRRREILEQALTKESGSVTLTINMDGALMKLTRARASSDQIQMQVGSTQNTLTSKDIRSLIRVQTFSQGELSHLGQETAEARLMELVTQPERDLFDETDQQIRAAADDLAAQLNRRVSAWGLEQRKRRTEAELQTTEARLEAQRGELSSSDPEATAIVNLNSAFDETDEFFRNVEEQIAEALENVSNAFSRTSDRVERILAQPASLNLPEVEVVRRALQELLHRLAKGRRYLSSAEQRFKIAVDGSEALWGPKYAHHREQYQAALEKLASHQLLAEQIQSLGNRLSELRGELESVQSQLHDLADAEPKFVEAVARHQDWQRSRIELTVKSAATVEYLSQGLARAEVSANGDFSAIHNALVSLFQGTAVREARLSDLLASIEGTSDPLHTWWTLLDEVLAILRWNVSGRKDIEARPQTPMLEKAIGDSSLVRFCEKLTTERAISALKAEMLPRIRITHVRHGRSVEFRQASQG